MTSLMASRSPTASSTAGCSLIASVVVLGAIMSILDTTVVNVADQHARA